MNRKKFNIKLDKEEQAMLSSVEKGEWQSVNNLEEEVAKMKQAATNFLRKNARVNIRISESDLMRLKRLAVYEGLPYQTLISSVLHKYAAGRLNIGNKIL